MCGICGICTCTEPRIRAHIFVCFLALVIRNILENKINALNKGVSYKEVIDALRCVEVVNVKIKDFRTSYQNRITI